MTVIPTAHESFPEPLDPQLASIELGYDAHEKYRLGQITDVQYLGHETFGMTAEEAPYAMYEVTVSDPYVERYEPEVRAEVAAAEHKISEYARQRREAGMWERAPGKAYVDDSNEQTEKKVWGDPVSTNIHFGFTLQSPGLRVWREELIPSATALACLADPDLSTTVTSPKTGEQYEIDEESRKWWALCTDAVAIRSRATVMAELVKEFANGQTGEYGEKVQTFNWMSIACGTALPTMKAAVHSEIQPSVTLIDYDRTAMAATEQLAAEIGFEGDITKRPMNIFSPDKMAKLKHELEAKGELPELVDMMGIFEYTGNNLGVDPVPFLRSGYDLVAPGGTLIFGQMRDDRPVEDFTMGVVGWPYVEQRSPKELMSMITDAGIDPKSVRMFMPSDGVYTVVAIDKPEASQAIAA